MTRRFARDADCVARAKTKLGALWEWSGGDGVRSKSLRKRTTTVCLDSLRCCPARCAGAAAAALDARWRACQAAGSTRRAARSASAARGFSDRTRCSWGDSPPAWERRRTHLCLPHPWEVMVARKCLLTAKHTKGGERESSVGDWKPARAPGALLSVEGEAAQPRTCRQASAVHVQAGERATEVCGGERLLA